MTIEHWIFLLEINVSFEIWMSQWSLAKTPNLSTDQDDEEKPKLPYLSSIPSVKFYVEFINIELAPFMFEKSIPDFYGLFLF